MLAAMKKEEDEAQEILDAGKADDADDAGDNAVPKFLQAMQRKGGSIKIFSGDVDNDAAAAHQHLGEEL